MVISVLVDGIDHLTIDDSENNELGGGSQGVVYRCEYKGKKLALKLYTAPEILGNKNFKNNLKENVANQSPDECFVWPQHFVETNNGRYGYIMELIDMDRYETGKIIYLGKKRIQDPKNHKKKITVDVGFKSDMAMITAAINICNAFRSLHRSGYAYQDVNLGGFFINPENGDVMVCDCDNIMASTSKNGTVLGTPGFIAPEIIANNNVMPNADTDKHSLAVLLFLLLMGGHPFDGKKRSGKEWSDSFQKRYYGSEATFIFDPNDDSNRPIPGLDINPIARWPLFPEIIRQMFIACFVNALYKPTARPTENKWVKALNQMRASTLECPKCGKLSFLEDSKISKGVYHCPHCKEKFGVLTVGIDLYPIVRGKPIYASSIGCVDTRRTIARIGEKSGKYGILNESNCEWTVVQKGVNRKAPSGVIVPLISETAFEFICEEYVNGSKTTRKGKGVVQ